MSIDRNFKLLREEYRDKNSRREHLISDIDELEQENNELRQEIAELKENRDTINQSIEVIKELVENIFEEKVNQYKNLIQRGLDAVFEDRNYEFDVEVDNRGHQKTAKLLYKEDDNDYVNLDNGSGAVRATVDLLTRVFLIHITGRRKFLVLDESLSSVGEEYIGNIVNFLDAIANEMGFDIVAISHARRLIEKADTVYRVTNGSVEVVDDE